MYAATSDMYAQEGKEPGCEAILSNDNRYRYYLSRAWGDHQQHPRTLGVVMLNPSTADAFVDDPTIRKVIGYAERWGYNRIAVGNLFAYRATDPNELITAEDPVGRWNYGIWQRIFGEADGAVFCGWGSHKMAPRMAKVFHDFHQTDGQMTKLVTIRVSEKTGMPYHPLYQKGDLEPFQWSYPK